jgi:WD40 repeat protein
VKAAVLSDKGQFAGVGSADGWLHWWEVDSRKRGNGSGSQSAVVAMETSPDGTLVITGTRDGWLHLSNWRGTITPEASPRVTKLGSLTAACLLPEERVLAGDESGDVHWYDTGLRRDVQPFHAHKGAVLDVAASPDGKRCVTSGADKVVTLWDLSKAGPPTVVRQWHGTAAPVPCVAFLRDGRRFLTGGEDKTVRLWEVSSGREVVRFAGHTDKVNAVAVSSDGKWAISAGADKQVLLWDLTKVP